MHDTNSSVHSILKCLVNSSSWWHFSSSVWTDASEGIYNLLSYQSNSVILNTYFRPSAFWLCLFFAIVTFCTWTKRFFICKECTNNRKNSLLSSYTVLWLANSEASACETSCLQLTVSAAGLSDLTMLHSQQTDGWLSFSSLSICQLSWGSLDLMSICSSQA